MPLSKHIYLSMTCVYICLHVYSPGMNAESEMDDKVIECCTDADVFVYVANGIATFEITVSQTLCEHKHMQCASMNTCSLYTCAAVLSCTHAH